MSADISSVSSSLPSQRLTRDTQSEPLSKDDRANQSANRAQSPLVQNDNDVELSRRQLTRNNEQKPLVEESSRLAEQLKTNQAEREKLQAERDRLVEQGQQDEGESPQQALQRIREAALESRFGTGAEDAGPLVTDSYFVTDNPVARLDNAISALERQAALTESEIDAIEAQFNEQQSEQQRVRFEPVETPEQAQDIAQTVSADIKAEPIVNISTVTAEDGTDILAILEV